jgi:hypothetical protein
MYSPLPPIESVSILVQALNKYRLPLKLLVTQRVVYRYLSARLWLLNKYAWVLKILLKDILRASAFTLAELP